MHIEFQNGAKGEYNNIKKIEVNNELERDILRLAIQEFNKQERKAKKTAYCEGELVTVISDNCRLPAGTLCAVMYVSELATPEADPNNPVYSYYIRNVESDYCCWAREDQIKGVI